MMVEKTTKTRVTTETVDLYVCPSCEQEYEPTEMLNMGLGTERSEAGSYASFEEMNMICENCAKSIFDYSGSGNTTTQKIKSEDNKSKNYDEITLRSIGKFFFAICSISGLIALGLPIFALLSLPFGIALFSFF